MSKIHYTKDGAKEVGAIYVMKNGILREVIAAYNGTKLIWQQVKSCFGSGKWDNNGPWDNDDAWKN